MTLGFVHGAHGQDLLDAGRATEVLRATGRVLARIHQLAVADVLPGSRAEAGEVLLHGDFGPNNLLLDLRTSEVVAVLDWEWAHLGRAIEDLAWCEWIVRMHHPKQVAALEAFFTAYGARPEWVERQAAMLTRCRQLISACASREPRGEGLRLWQARAAVTASWAEL